MEREKVKGIERCLKKMKESKRDADDNESI